MLQFFFTRPAKCVSLLNFWELWGRCKSDQYSVTHPPMRLISFQFASDGRPSSCAWPLRPLFSPFIFLWITHPPSPVEAQPKLQLFWMGNQWRWGLRNGIFTQRMDSSMPALDDTQPHLDNLITLFTPASDDSMCSAHDVFFVSFMLWILLCSCCPGCRGVSFPNWNWLPICHHLWHSRISHSQGLNLRVRCCISFSTPRDLSFLLNWFLFPCLPNLFGELECIFPFSFCFSCDNKSDDCHSCPVLASQSACLQVHSGWFPHHQFTDGMGPPSSGSTHCQLERVFRGVIAVGFF